MTRKLRTDYVGHDRAYVKRRAAGQPGWDADYQTRLRQLEIWLAKPHVPQSGKLLELGCGAGNMSEYLARKGFEVTGIDIAPAAIAWAKERFANATLNGEFHVGSVCELPFADDFFDVVYDSHCFHCIIGDDRAKFLAEARRVLQPGGILHIDTMSGESTQPEITDTMDPDTRLLMHGDLATRYIGLHADIIEEVRAAGFKIIQAECIPDGDDPDDTLIDATPA